jgi:DNA-binding transcriptional ArsR family regulator
MITDTIKKAEQQAAFHKVLSNPRRLLILWILAKGELSVNEIASHAGSTLQNVSQHLGLLKRAGILDTQRVGHTVYYKIADYSQIDQYQVMLDAPDIFKKEL